MPYGLIARALREGGLLGDLKRQAIGAADAGLAVGSSIAGSVPAGVNGLLELATTRDPDKAAAEVERSSNILQYRPRTREGAEHLERLGAGIESAGNYVANTGIGRAANEQLDQAAMANPAMMALAVGALNVAGPGKAKPSNLLSAAADVDRLAGLPAFATAAGEKLPVVPVSAARDAAATYKARTGIGHDAPRDYAKVDPEVGKRVAAAYEEMPHAPEDPAVKASYRAMIDETVEQWRDIEKTGLKVEFIKPGMKDPYAKSPRLAIEDVRKNNHLWVYPTDSGFGSNSAFDVSKNPLFEMTDIEIDGQRLRANDVFRIVHDYFGHAKEGVGFRADGEENAWRQHASMYSELARGAMTSETRGQNSWVNWGPHGEKNRSASGADTTYADQKTGLLPREFWSNEALGLPPRNGIMFPEYAERYPPVPPAVTKFDKKKGKSFEGRGQTPETKSFMSERAKIVKDIDENGVSNPYFNADERFDADPKNYPTQYDTLAQGLPKKQATVDKWRSEIQTDDARARLQKAYDDGIASGYNDAWYKMGQLEKEFVDELGPEEGRRMFRERFADAMASTTSGATPTNNLLMAHLGNFMRGRGKRAPERTTEQPVPIIDLRGNMKMFNSVINDGNRLDFNQPKRHNFGRNFEGHTGPSTIDEQMTDLITPGEKSPPGDSYFAYEELVAEMARKNGVDPRDFQDVVWGGKKAAKGSYKGKPMIQIVNEAIERTHRLTGMPKKEIVRRGLVRAEIPLYGVAGGLLAPFFANQEQQ